MPAKIVGHFRIALENKALAFMAMRRSRHGSPPLQKRYCFCKICRKARRGLCGLRGEHMGHYSNVIISAFVLFVVVAFVYRIILKR